MPRSFARILLCLALVVVAVGSVGAEEAGPIAPSPVGSVLPGRLQPLLEYRTLKLRDDGAPHLQRARLAGEKAPASLNAIILRCDFSDSLLLGRFGQVPGDFPEPRQSEIYYAAHDSLFFSHLFQDVADYYHDVSDGAFTFHFTIHPRVINLPHPMEFYGNDPVKGEQNIALAADVVDSLDGEIDFSSYDTYILIHAGAGEETDILGNSPEQIYSNFLGADDFQQAFDDGDLEQPWLPSNDFSGDQGIDQVLILPECEYQDAVGGFGGYFGSLGVYCFEVGLRLGMLSLSDFTPAGHPDSQGIGEFGLMGYGLFVGMGFIPPHPCAFNKLLMGWLDPVKAEATSGGLQKLTPCERSAEPNAALRVELSGQEYWLLAYRLQDPDGNRIFSFPGDLNGNNIPDFFDADSPWGNGVPPWGEKFDPATDTREQLLGAEWDFFMSENSARSAGEKGAGSGLYIWHVDEGVIQDVFSASSNLFNADPARKAVDLEEADGIQDLDSREPSAYLLGGDDDSFRGEDNAVFGPDTNPDTRSAGGVATGTLMQNISGVVTDSTAFVVAIDESVSPPDTLWGLAYADTMSLQLSLAPSSAGAPQLLARREMPAGVDLRGSHVLLVDLQGNGSAREIVVSGALGEVFALDGALNNYAPTDPDSTSIEPLAVGTFAGDPVRWNPPATAGDFDGDGDPEIFLTADQGLYGFDNTGAALADENGNYGLLAAAEHCTLPPVLVPRQREEGFAADQAVQVCFVFQEAGESHLRLYGDPAFDFNLGAVQVLAPPVYAWDALLVAVTDSVAGQSQLLFCQVGPDEVPGQPRITSLDLELTPGPFPVLAGLVDPGKGNLSTRYVLVPGFLGGGQTLEFDGDDQLVAPAVFWPEDTLVASPLAPGGAFVGDGILGRVGRNGTWLDGWPRRPFEPLAQTAPLTAGCPLVLGLPTVAASARPFLFPTPDGRLLASGLAGEGAPELSLAGPARSVGTPAVGAVRDLSGNLNLVAAGSFPRITGRGDEESGLETTFVSNLMVWSLPGVSDPVWPMWGGSPWRNGSWNMEGWNAPPVTAPGNSIVPGSHICYPSPLGNEPLQVRAQVRANGRVRVFVHNLEGQEVAVSSWVQVSAEDPFTVSLSLDGAASGMYLCRLVAETGSGSLDSSVVPFAVVR